MKRYNSLYYFLIVLLIMGAFASMAQNSYGQKILGLVSIASGASFLLQLINSMRGPKHKTTGVVIELTALIILSFLWPLRLFYIPVPYSELITGIAGGLLVLVYGQRLILRFKLLHPKNHFLAWMILDFHGSLILFIVAILMVPNLPELSKAVTITALVMLLLFLVIAFFNRRFPADGESVSAFSVVAHFRDRSFLLISIFFIFSIYLLFSGTGILPRLYSDDFPQAYFELVNRAERGKDTPVNGRQQHEIFKEQYDEFLKRNLEREK